MSKQNKILLIIILNSIIVISELVFGFISNSYALIADALHNVGDILAIIITYTAIVLAAKKTTFKFTYGYIKAEMMAAFVNSFMLIIAMLYVMYEAINKIGSVEIVNPIYMIVVGTIAVIANGLSAVVLHKLGVEHHHHDHDHGHHHNHDHHHGELELHHEHDHEHKHQEDLNIKSAYLHMLGDALISVGVIVAGIFIYFFEIYSIDAYLTIVFSIYIILHSWNPLKKSFLYLMDINDSEITITNLNEIIMSHTEVLEYHDLHIHTPNSKNNHITFHLVLKDENTTIKEAEKIVLKIKEELKKEGFNHIIVQTDSHQFVKGNSENEIGCVHY